MLKEKINSKESQSNIAFMDNDDRYWYPQLNTSLVLNSYDMRLNKKSEIFDWHEDVIHYTN